MLSYLLAFFMAVMILVVSLQAFAIIQTEGRELTAGAQVQDVVNRVSLSIQEGLQVARARNETQGSANSTQLRFSHSITVPARVQGWQYEVTLDENFINGTVPAPGVEATPVPTLNVAVSLPPAGVCTAEYLVCEIGGTSTATDGQIVMTYLYDESVVPIVNEIEIA